MRKRSSPDKKQITLPLPVPQTKKTERTKKSTLGKHLHNFVLTPLFFLLKRFMNLKKIY